VEDAVGVLLGLKLVLVLLLPTLEPLPAASLAPALFPFDDVGPNLAINLAV
jgi:hypothetical protein